MGNGVRLRVAAGSLRADGLETCAGMGVRHPAGAVPRELSRNIFIYENWELAGSFSFMNEPLGQAVSCGLALSVFHDAVPRLDTLYVMY